MTQYYVSQLAYLASRLDAMPEGEGTVLDNTCLLFINSLWSGSKHDASKVPVVLAGGLGGTLQTGRVLDYCDKGDDNRKLCGHVPGRSWTAWASSSTTSATPTRGSKASDANATTLRVVSRPFLETEDDPIRNASHRSGPTQTALERGGLGERAGSSASTAGPTGAEDQVRGEVRVVVGPGDRAGTTARALATAGRRRGREGRLRSRP